MKLSVKNLLIFLLFVTIPVILFRNYFFKNQIPFPSNLLVSYYEPWKSYPYPGYPNGPPNKPLGFDNLRQYFPQKTLVIGLLNQLQPPLWNPYAFSGNTLLGTYQSSIFHPLSLFYFILPQIDAFSIIIILQPFFALLFMYLFLRSQLLSKLSCIMGSLAFALSGFAIVWWEESYMIGYSSMVLPLILYSIEMISKQKNRIYVCLLVFGICWSVFSGSFQLTFYVLGFTVLFVIWKLLTKKIRSPEIITIFLATFVAFCICAVQLVPGYEAYTQSARGTTDAKFLFTGYLLPVKNLITLISPDFFGTPAAYNYYGTGFYHEQIAYFGIIPLVLMLLAFSYLTLKDRVSFWGYCFLFFLSLSLNLSTSWFFLYTLKLPLISTMIPSRILFLSMFCGSVLSAYGMEYFLSNTKTSNIIKTLITIASVYVYIWYGIWRDSHAAALASTVHIQYRNMVVPTVLLICTGVLLLFGKSSYTLRKLTSIGLIILTIGGSLYFANKYLFFSERQYVFPKTPVISKLQSLATTDRVWTFGSGKIESNFMTQYSLYSPEGYDSFNIQRYGELLYAGSHTGSYSKEIDRSDAVILSESRVDKILSDPFRVRLLKLLGVKYIAGHLAPPRDVKLPIIPPPELSQVWSDGIYAIYEYTDTLPRALLVNDYEVIKDNQKILHTLFSDTFNPKQTLILEEQPEQIPSSSEFTGEATFSSYTPQEIIIKTKSSTAALLFLSDNYYPGWKATVDEKPTKIYRANYTFRAVSVPEGSHTVIFRYQPESWKYGMMLSLSGLIALCILMIKLPNHE